MKSLSIVDIPFTFYGSLLFSKEGRSISPPWSLLSELSQVTRNLNLNFLLSPLLSDLILDSYKVLHTDGWFYRETKWIKWTTGAQWGLSYNKDVFLVHFRWLSQLFGLLTIWALGSTVLIVTGSLVGILDSIRALNLSQSPRLNKDNHVTVPLPTG